MTSTTGTISLDTALHLLGKPRRRQLLRELDRRQGPVTVGELADELGARRADGRGRIRTTTALCHVSLPMLDDADVVEYDVEGATVRRGPTFEEVVDLLHAIRQQREQSDVTGERT